MASNTEINGLHIRVAAVAEKVRALQKELEETLSVNVNAAVDWRSQTIAEQLGLASPDSYFSEAEGGSGEYSPNQVADAIGSMQELNNLLGGSAAATGNHLGTVDKLCTAASKRLLTRATDG